MPFYSIAPYFICMAIMLVVARANAAGEKRACRCLNSSLDHLRR